MAIFNRGFSMRASKFVPSCLLQTFTTGHGRSCPRETLLESLSAYPVPTSPLPNRPQWIHVYCPEPRRTAYSAVRIQCRGGGTASGQLGCTFRGSLRDHVGVELRDAFFKDGRRPTMNHNGLGLYNLSLTSTSEEVLPLVLVCLLFLVTQHSTDRLALALSRLESWL